MLLGPLFALSLQGREGKGGVELEFLFPVPRTVRASCSWELADLSSCWQSEGCVLCLFHHHGPQGLGIWDLGSTAAGRIPAMLGGDEK